eukprot:augustus_masked-scaffold_13-processed-gene-8.22-mRNA-1 protein AED:0.02 eAED:0.08 QI:0/-1/0/1/-1/1/1/0/834
MSTGLYFYIEKHPSLIEKYILDKTTKAFAGTLAFETRKKVFLNLPEPYTPTLESMKNTLVAAINQRIESSSEEELGMDFSEAQRLKFWSDMVTESLDKVETNWLLTTKKAMRDKLVEEAKTKDIREEMTILREIIPASVERNILFDKKVEETISQSETKTISAEILEENKPQFDPKTCDVITRILVHSVSFFPGPAHELLSLLKNESSRSAGAQDQVFPRGSFNPRTVSAERPSILQKLSFWLNSSPVLNDSGNIERKETKIRKLRNYLTKEKFSYDSGKDSLFNIKNSPGFKRIKDLYDSLCPEMQSYVLQSAVSSAIETLNELSSNEQFNPKKIYEIAVEEGLINSLRSDARIDEEILSEVKQIYMALPSNVQSRVLLKAVDSFDALVLRGREKKFSGENETNFEAAELVRDLLTAGGVVAVKLGQMLAEHPRMPIEYQKLLGSLREANEPMPISNFWFSIPTAVRSNISALGACIGTGSVKQVHYALYKGQNLAEKEKPVAVLALLNGVQDEALSSVTALESSEQIGPVAQRLGRLVFNEFNLFEEGEVLNEFALTKIGVHELFRVVNLFHHSPQCLVEELAEGESVASFLGDPEKSSDKVDQLPEDLRVEVERVKEILTEYHKAVFSAFVEDGLVHSDIHLGNAVVSRNEANQIKGFVLFDVGQFERISPAETKALLWTLGSVSSANNRIVLKDVAIGHLIGVCKIDHENNYVQKLKQELRKAKKGKDLSDNRLLFYQLSKAYAESILPNEEGVVPETKIIYIKFLRNAEKIGVRLPRGAFSMAKMLDGIISQFEQYKLFDVVDDSITKFLKANMTWGELTQIGYRYVFK